MTADTIAAIATPPGKGGIGIVRVSGDAVPQLIQQLFGQALKPRQAELLPFKDKAGHIIDRGIVLYFSAPHSYTGEHVLELQGHGGPVVLDMLLQNILSQGVRLAKAGEFTERAFLNEKMDLAQAEAVIDLIESSSTQAALAAARSLEGNFSKTINALLDRLIQLRLYIEAALDFPEEEIDFLSDQQLHQRLADLHTDLDNVFHSVKQGRLLKEGLNVVILGQPNAGKSSLLNQLAGKNSAIVTDIAGTTRDVLREHIHIDGMPLHIIDTAGLRESPDVIEQEGVKRAWQEVEHADRVLLLVDVDKGWSTFEEQVLDSVPQNSVVDIIYNKIDSLHQAPYIEKKTPHSASHSGVNIGLSAKTGEGLALLTEHLKQSVGFEQTGENQFSARRRHVLILEALREHSQNAKRQLQQGAGELAAEELRLAQDKLASITGEFSSDDLLGEIFSSFCIGK